MIPSNELHRVPRKKHKDPHAPTSGYETSDTVLSDGDRDRYVIHGAATNSMHRGSSRGAQSDNELTARDLAVIAAQRQRHALQHQMHQQQQDLSPALQVPRPSRPHRHSSGLSGSFSALALSQEDPAQRKPIMGPPRHSMFEMNHEDALNKEKMSRTQQRLQHSRELPMLPVLNQSSHSLAHGPTSAEQVLNLPLNSSSSRAVHIGQHSGGSSFNYSAGATQQPVSISSRHNRKMSSVSMSEDETLSRASSDPLSPMGPPEMAGRRPSGGTVSNNMPRVAVRNLPPLTNQQLSATSPRQFLPNNSGSVVYSPVPPFSPYSQSFERDRSEVSSPLPPADPTFARPLPLARQHSNSRVHYSTEPENDFSDRSDVCGNPNCHCTPSPRPHHSHMQNASPQFPHPPPPSQYSHHPRAPITPQHHPQHYQSPPPPYPPQQQYGQGILIGIDTPPPLPPRQMQSGVRQRSGSVVSAGAGEMPQAPLSPQPVDPPPNPSESMGMSTTDWMQLLKNYRTKAGAETAPAPATTAAS